jgi:hypothetical protein
VFGTQKTKGIEMIFITAKFRIKPDEAVDQDDWSDLGELAVGE